jgi:malonate-semialdehyde dehydrogenase (acetylating)/methylmalonate-semialdehyde dehydrogenase
MAVLPEVKKQYGRQKFYINGEWVESGSGVVSVNTNPGTGEAISELPQATSEEARAAVEAAHVAFGTWRDVPMRDRAGMLFDLRGTFKERYDELCRILTQDHGRTIGEAEGSVSRVIENIESACSAVYGLAKQNELMYQVATGYGY